MPKCQICGKILTLFPFQCCGQNITSADECPKCHSTDLFGVGLAVSERQEVIKCKKCDHIFAVDLK